MEQIDRTSPEWRRAAERYPAVAAGHSHAEAFNLMWYKCLKCGHMERFWNSRDGVTPFGTACPSCGRPDLCHAYMGSDSYAPDHKPHKGQRIWIDVTPEIAARWAERVIRLRPDLSEEDRVTIRASYASYVDTHEPALKVFGYEEIGP